MLGISYQLTRSSIPAIGNAYDAAAWSYCILEGDEGLERGNSFLVFRFRGNLVTVVRIEAQDAVPPLTASSR